jgi:hypothetical protein
MMRSKPSKRTGRAFSGVRPATIVELDGNVAMVRVTASRGESKDDNVAWSSAASSSPAQARMTLIAGYKPTVGDRVLVAGEDEAFIIGVLHAACPPSVTSADGSSATIEDGALTLRDAEGLLLVRHRDGVTEIAAARGDLQLSAPEGRVSIQAGTDVVIEAARDLIQHAPRRVELGTGARDRPEISIEPNATKVRATRLEVESQSARVVSGQVAVFANRIATTAKDVVQEVERYELTATRIVERAKDAFRDVTDLAQSRMGRVRTVVRDVYSLQSRRAVMTSTDETVIDGKKILLG